MNKKTHKLHHEDGNNAKRAAMNHLCLEKDLQGQEKVGSAGHLITSGRNW